LIITVAAAHAHTDLKCIADIARLQGVECTFPNTLHREFHTTAWTTLLSRIGDDLMLHLLLRHTVLLRLRNSCYMQVTGPPLGDVVQAMNTAASTASTTAGTGAAAAAGSSSSTAASAKAPTTAGVMLPRRCIFYSSAFVRRAALPPSNQLNAKGDAPAVAQSLLTAMFAAPRSSSSSSSSAASSSSDTAAVATATAAALEGLAVAPAGRKQNRQHAKSSSSSSSSKRLRQVLPVLTELVQRHRRCQYGRLLERHCPLPSEFRERIRVRARSSSNSTNSRNSNSSNSKAAATELPMAAALSRDGYATQAEDTQQCNMYDSDSDNGVPMHNTSAYANGRAAAKPYGSSSGSSSVRAGTSAATTAAATVAVSDISEQEAEWTRLDAGRDFIALATDHAAVADFVRAALFAVLPEALLGSRANAQKLAAAVQRYVQLRRHERMCVREAREGMSVHAIAWLDPASKQQPATATAAASRNNGSTTSSSSSSSGSKKRRRSSRRPPSDLAHCTELLDRLVHWAFAGFVAPLLAASFYITECEGTLHRLHYFRRPVWCAFARAAMSRLSGAGGGQLAPLTPAAAAQLLAQHSNSSSSSSCCADSSSAKPAALSRGGAYLVRTSSRPTAAAVSAAQVLEFPAVRLVPKKTGARAITNMSRRPAAANSSSSNSGSSATVSSSWGGARQSSNMLLAPAFLVLKHELQAQPELIGAGVFGMDDMFARLKPFVLRARAARAPAATTATEHTATSTGCSATAQGILRSQLPPLPLPLPALTPLLQQQQLYFVSCDVQHCFDTVDPARLATLLSPALTHDEYLVQRWSAVHPYRSHGRLHCARRRDACALSDVAPFRARAVAAAATATDTVFCDGVLHVEAARSDVSAALQKHLFAHIVRVPDARGSAAFAAGRDERGHRRYTPPLFHQASGIPQGSVLSTLLCNVYYGHVEQALFAGVLVQPQQTAAAAGASTRSSSSSSTSSGGALASLLMRLVDDFLLITHCRTTADRFVAAAHSPERTALLGITINPSKTLTNFVIAEPPARTTAATAAATTTTAAAAAAAAPPVKRIPDGQPFPWCGLLFDTASCAVRGNYTRYCAAEACLADALTVETARCPGLALRTKAKAFLAPKCHPLLLDGALNSGLPSVLRAAYELLLLCAAKTVVHAAQLPRGVQSNPGHVAACARDAVVYAFSLVRSRCDARRRPFGSSSSNSSSSSGVSDSEELLCACPMTRSQALWLGLHAFAAVLSRPDVSREFREVRQLLARDLRQQSSRVTSDMQLLQSVVTMPDVVKLAAELKL
jgi:Telomerase ribonucleoprotein complex - RNA binding domain